MEVLMKRCSFQLHTGQLSMTCHPNALSFDPRVSDTRHICAQIAQYLSPDISGSIIWQRPPGQSNMADIRNVIGLCYSPQQKVTMNARRADGIILRDPNITVAVTSRDCPYLVLWSEQMPCVAVLHCGRDQLHNILEGHVDESVIANAIPWFGNFFEPEQIFGAIVMGIAPENFANARYPEITTALSRRWGISVVPDQTRHTIDLKELILRQLESYKIPRENIQHDGVDTYSDKYLASLRAGRGGHNLLLVTSK